MLDVALLPHIDGCLHNHTKGLVEYNGFIFTKHALERLQLRSVSQDDVVKVLQKPERTESMDKPGSSKFIRTLNDRQIQVVAKYLSDQKKWLIVSVWVRGEEDPTPLVWQVITLPFRLVWWVLKRIISGR